MFQEREQRLGGIVLAYLVQKNEKKYLGIQMAFDRLVFLSGH